MTVSPPPSIGEGQGGGDVASSKPATLTNIPEPLVCLMFLAVDLQDTPVIANPRG